MGYAQAVRQLELNHRSSEMGLLLLPSLEQSVQPSKEAASV